MTAVTDGFPSGDAATRRLTGTAGRVASILAAGLSLYALYWVLFIVQPQVYRVSFLLVALVLTFLLFPRERGALNRTVDIVDWCLIAAAIAALAWPLVDFDRFVYRAARPWPIDLALGAITIVLVLEATRRTVGWILPTTAVAFLLYAWWGPVFDRIGLPLLAHRGYGFTRLIGTLYMTLEGIFGVPLDVAATYIVLFTIYGSLLEASGAARFFIDWALAVFGRSRSAAAPARSVTAAGFLLGTVSGSGVATTVMLGSVGWPLLRNAGYRPETAGAMLSAAGIGALLSPPTLGAAAFLIAEFLRISYLDVLVMAIVPTLLYYLSIFLMIEADARNGDTQLLPGDSLERVERPRFSLSYHFTSLVALASFMAMGMSAFRAVFWAAMLAIALSFLRRDTALTPPRLLAALRSGSIGVLGVAATTATAGIIVGVVTLTGLGLKVAGIIVALAGGTLVLTVVYSAIAVLLLGLAVPVTASYIIAAVMVAPALVQTGVPDVAAHMFIFYYAVLSEVSPPTALSPFAASAITGGNPFTTMMLTWRYTLPAFVVPFMFTLTPDGLGLLLQAPAVTILLVCGSAALGIAAIAGGLAGWLSIPLNRLQRGILVAAGGLLVAPLPWADLAGLGLMAVVPFLQSVQRSHPRAQNGSS
jgi:TRAP transporter 4TM/12TM fusion protein